ncbi:MacB family efflux pump subunit [Stenotrophomonas sp. GD03701]|uniref:Pyoverdine export ATP-binding/permease protein PvdT n=1 Tax=Stenotrophomonas maltophilia TaxID=40324 RepID=A0A2J0SN13_STEMA|nr:MULTISPECIES: MacB family efflux pump subunit [Stenotrophomonas]MBA0310505.1 MacB family efflux pump subunit [Stenotrophomonas maltophilia]MBH1864611.1 MacB family efflux pump subunit [Stenotrophomonas maltophilia]MDH1387475.1 MacB family efflux pump subunit [Stenotrophomonas sp. GD03701]MDH1392390.1 MacB family efflux pump subunit [Stenotrophomonas sp. GD03702]MDQ7300929.1 MacB family efflux pump subunit [Stenotrophomonas sp. Sm0581]
MSTTTTEPLLRVRGVRREFAAGEQTLVVLDGIDLDIHAGELVAIVGQSGSGKSTLMNILGCLDRPSTGIYQIDGRETAQMSPDELAELRREHFGFIFQRYHLLTDLTALGNVEVPAIYAGMPAEARHARAATLLSRLGLGERMQHLPGELSGGQQQRVSIARALMNGGAVIFADEPTGALDTHSGKEVMKILGELHAEGHTVVLVTHDMAVAEHAQRIIEIRDGRIVDDRATGTVSAAGVATPAVPQRTTGGWQVWRDRFAEAFRMALRAMNAHRMRTFLTMLGIIIGIASVVSVVALGTGARQAILSNIASLGTNTIEIYPGSGFGDLHSARVETLTPGDSVALARQPFVDSATPGVATTGTALRGNRSASVQVQGVSEQYFRVHGLKLGEGAFFGPPGVSGYQQVVVIDANTRARFFAAADNPIGQTLLLGNMPVRIVAVVKKDAGAAGDASLLRVWLPYTTAMARMLGQSHVSSITVRVSDAISMEAAEQAIARLLTRRHGSTDFYMSNNAQIRESIEQTTGILTMMISSIAAIALVVGGIGVMNIMLVSVTERTREIGVRMAVGARRSDILQQFLIESVLVCLLGGVLGIGVALALGAALELADAGFSLVFSVHSILAAFACSSLIGIGFGFLPARRAAQLDPVEALVR